MVVDVSCSEMGFHVPVHAPAVSFCISSYCFLYYLFWVGQRMGKVEWLLLIFCLLMDLIGEWYICFVWCPIQHSPHASSFRINLLFIILKPWIVFQNWMEDLSAKYLRNDKQLMSLTQLLKCLKIMENATFLSKDNQVQSHIFLFLQICQNFVIF